MCIHNICNLAHPPSASRFPHLQARRFLLTHKEQRFDHQGPKPRILTHKEQRFDHQDRSQEYKTTTMMQQDVFPTTDILLQSPMRRLRNLGFRRSYSTPQSSKMNKYSHSSSPWLSMSTLAIDTSSDFVSVCSAEPLVFGCLKVRTHKESLRRSYHIDGPESRSIEFSTIEVRGVIR
jgi:hypothetical protein